MGSFVAVDRVISNFAIVWRFNFYLLGFLIIVTSSGNHPKKLMGITQISYVGGI